MNKRVNYLDYIPRDWAWYDVYKSAMGVEALLTFVNKVYAFLTEMKPGSFFKMDGGVKPENADLFIKVCCLFISEYSDLHGCTDYYEFNADATQIRRIRHVVPVKKQNANKSLITL